MVAGWPVPVPRSPFQERDVENRAAASRYGAFAFARADYNADGILDTIGVAFGAPHMIQLGLRGEQCDEPGTPGCDAQCLVVP